jgi:hypothetical protein
MRRHHRNHWGRTWALPLSPDELLELQTDWGRVGLVPLEPGEEPYLEALGGNADDLEVRIERAGDAVRVAVGQERPFNRWWGQHGPWDTRLVLHLPAAVRARVETSAGSIDASGLDGCDLELKTNAGRLGLRQVRGRLKLSADAGSISGRDLAGWLDAETQAGSVRLELLGLEPGEHQVRATMGSVRIELARGADVRVEARAGLGSVHSRFPSRAEAAAVLRLETEMGSIRVSEGPGPAVPSGADWPAPPAAHRRVAWQAETSQANWSGPATERSATGTAVEAGAATIDPGVERILKLVESGQLSARDADELLQALGRS